MEPQPLRGRDVRERVERVDRAGVDRPRRADEQRRQGAARPIGGDRRAQRRGVEPAPVERHLAHRRPADAEQLQRAPHAAVGLGGHVRDEPRGAREPVAPHVVADRRQRTAASAGEADDRRGRPAAREQAAARRVRKADELGQPAHDRVLEVDVGVVPGDDARVHRRRRQRGHDPRRGRRRVDPAEERGVAVAHGVRQDVAQRGRHQLVERARRAPAAARRAAARAARRGAAARPGATAARRGGRRRRPRARGRRGGTRAGRLRAPRSCPLRSRRKHKKCAGLVPDARIRTGQNGDGAKRIRTADLLGAIQALSQLSYSPASDGFYRTRGRGQYT